MMIINNVLFIFNLIFSSKWMYDGSSFYSSTLREKTDSSEVEVCTQFLFFLMS